MFAGWRERERERERERDNIVVTTFVFKDQVGQF